MIRTSEPLDVLKGMGCQLYGLEEGFYEFETDLCACLDVPKGIFEWRDRRGKDIRFEVEMLAIGLENGEFVMEYLIEPK